MTSQTKFELRKLIKVGNSYAVVLPKEYISYLNLIPHDKLVIKITNHSIILTKFNFKGV